MDAFLSVLPEQGEELREKVTRTPDLRVHSLVLGEEFVAGRKG